MNSGVEASGTEVDLQKNGAEGAEWEANHCQ